MGDLKQNIEPDDPEYKELKEEVLRLVFQAVDELPPRCREVFELYIQGNNAPQISQMLDLSVETVRTHRKLALRTLRKKMEHLFVLALFFNIF